MKDDATINQKKINVLILTADAGFGHRSAANAVAASLQEAHEQECRVDIVNPLEDKRTPFFLRDSQADYDKIIRSIPQLYRIGFEASDATLPSVIVESALTVMLYEVMYDIIHKYKPDVILNTFPIYHSALYAVFTITRRKIPMLTVITDLSTIHRLWFNDHVDGYLVPNIEVRDHAIEHGVSVEKIFITGIPVHPDISRQKKPREAIRKSLQWDPKLTTILVVGSRRVDNLLDVLNIINHFGAPLQLAIVAGKDEVLYEQLKTIEWHIPAHIYDFSTNIPQMMLAADCIVSKAGGLIVTEALASGLPMILIDVIKGQETGNADFVVESGSGDLALTPMKFLETLSHWLMDNQGLLKQRAENAHLQGKPYSAFHVSDLLMQAARKKVTLDALLPKRSYLIELLTKYQVHFQESILPFRKK